MRALIMLSASLLTVMEPSSTCVTNSFTRSLPRSLAVASLPMRPCSTIWSSSPSSLVSVVVWPIAAFCGSLMGTSLGHADFAFELFALLGIADGIEQQLLQLVIALQAAAKIGKPGAEFEQLAQGFHLAGDVFGFEIVHGLEVEVHF